MKSLTHKKRRTATAEPLWKGQLKTAGGPRPVFPAIHTKDSKAG